MEEQNSIDGKVNVFIDRDLLKAYVEITPPVGNGKPCTLEMVKNALKEKQVTFGINEDYLKKALEEKNWGYKVLVAEGIAPINGKDAKIIYKFPLPAERLAPKIDEKGKVNYHDLGLIYNVKLGQLLVEKIPADDGVPGTSVMGTQLPAKKGKDILLPRGSNTMTDQDGLNLYAAMDGHVTVINNKVTVDPVLIIPGDIDFSTGDIDFGGNILINGNINAGFKVKSGGDIEVKGFVEAAEVTAAGSIMVRGGITGCTRTLIKAGYDIYAQFVENSRLDAGRDIIVRQAIMQSAIKAGGNVKVSGDKALIVGGSIQAGRELEAKIIGSRFSTQTIIQVGIDPHLRDEYLALSGIWTEKKKALNNLNNNIKLIQRSGISRLPDQKKETLISMLNEQKKQWQEIEQINERIIELEKKFTNTHAAKVRVSGVVYPGVRITIGQSVYIVNDPIKYSEFILDQGEVRLRPLQ